MADAVDEAERSYRVIDGIYRLHRDLFEIENVLTRTGRLQLRLARINANGRMGVFAAGLLAIVPILISLGDIKWNSAPALTIYCLVVGVVLLWIYQTMAAGDIERQLAALEGYTSTDPLEHRIDFVLEEMNSWVVRYKFVEGILRALRKAMNESKEDDGRQELKERIHRYEEILKSCEDSIADLVAASERLVTEKKRSRDDHNEVVDWAAAVSKFRKPAQGNS